MKKVLICISSLVIVLMLIIGVEYCYSNEKIEFIGEAKNLEYYFEKMYFYNTLQGEFDATANILKSDTNIIALDANSKIQFKLPHKPIRIYELSANEPNGKMKIYYDKKTKLYTLSDLFENEVCEYDIVVDYGIIKNLYCFQVYNKTYIEKYGSEKLTADMIKSSYDLSKSSRTVVVNLNKNKYQCGDFSFGFSVHNGENSLIACSFFKVEKQIGNDWYIINEKDTSYNANGYEKIKKQVETAINPNTDRMFELGMSVEALFELSDLISGTYRIVIPYECNGNDNYTISAPFTIGYVD